MRLISLDYNDSGTNHLLTYEEFLTTTDVVFHDVGSDDSETLMLGNFKFIVCLLLHLQFETDLKQDGQKEQLVSNLCCH